MHSLNSIRRQVETGFLPLRTKGQWSFRHERYQPKDKVLKNISTRLFNAVECTTEYKSSLQHALVLNDTLILDLSIIVSKIKNLYAKNMDRGTIGQEVVRQVHALEQTLSMWKLTRSHASCFSLDIAWRLGKGLTPLEIHEELLEEKKWTELRELVFFTAYTVHFRNKPKMLKPLLDYHWNSACQGIVDELRDIEALLNYGAVLEREHLQQVCMSGSRNLVKFFVRDEGVMLPGTDCVRSFAVISEFCALLLKEDSFRSFSTEEELRTAFYLRMQEGAYKEKNSNLLWLPMLFSFSIKKFAWNLWTTGMRIGSYRRYVEIIKKSDSFNGFESLTELKYWFLKYSTQGS